MLWPDVPSTLFASDTRFPFHSAHVEWVLERRDVTAYREGYRRGAILLAQNIDHGEHPPELMLWPIAWLWRHYLELALKEIIALGPLLSDDSAEWVWPTGAGHRLGELWRRAKDFIEPLGEPTAPELEHVTAIIAEFDALDRDGTGFRYPLARNGERNLVAAPAHVNVGLLDETMQRLSNFLGIVQTTLSRELARLRDQMRETYENSYDSATEDSYDDPDEG
jgi:hypothetical protein